MNRRFALRGDDAVRAYLEYVDDDRRRYLRDNYLQMARAIKMQLEGGNTMKYLLGPVDADKALSSFRLFGRITRHVTRDSELERACRRVLELQGEEIALSDGGSSSDDESGSNRRGFFNIRTLRRT